MTCRVGIGQDSHRFLAEDALKPCIIGGVVFEEVPGFAANSDGDVVFHALCNAISSLTGVIILGDIADKLLETEGITDSALYLEKALATLKGERIVHAAITLEGLRPKFLPHLQKMKASVAKTLKVQPSQVGITATTGEGLTDYGCGQGVQCFCVLTVQTI